MNFKSISLKTAVATALMAGSTLAITPAYAATLAPGSFILEGKSQIANPVPSTFPNTFTLKFTDFTFASKDGVLASLTGTPTLANLDLTRVNSTTFSKSTGTANFITGLKLGADNVFFDLDPITFTGTVKNATTYSLFAETISGILRDASDSVIGTGTAAAYKFKVGGQQTNFASVGVQTTAVPTPALLPGLLALGAGILRKRKQGVNREAEA